MLIAKNKQKNNNTTMLTNNLNPVDFTHAPNLGIENHTHAMLDR